MFSVFQFLHFVNVILQNKVQVLCKLKLFNWEIDVLLSLRLVCALEELVRVAVFCYGF